MKIAISGKGGVGKTLLSSLLSKTFSEAGYSVIAIDADPDANLAATLGFPNAEDIVPISEMDELIEERTGAKPGQSAPFYTLNPKVDDIPERFAHKLNGIRLMRMGRIKKGGTGCYCPEGALLQALMAHLLVARNEVVILDMEAGIEHLGRGTAAAVDKLIVVVEPGRRSIETAVNIKKLAAEIGLKDMAIVGNKVRNQSDIDFLKASLPGFEFLGFIPYDQAIVNADLANKSPLDASEPAKAAVSEIYQALLAGVLRQKDSKRVKV
ncbi:MAG: carbon monoxide dehydrogenase accessory protein CooC [Chloroflexota bacterium]